MCCHNLRQNISHARNEEETRRVVVALTEHMEQAQQERTYYNDAIARAQGSLENIDRYDFAISRLTSHSSWSFHVTREK